MVDKRAKPGPFMKTPMASAAVQNRVLDASDAWHNQKRLGDTQTQFRHPISTDKIKIKNDSGGDLVAGSVLQVTDKAIDELSAAYLWFNGDTYDATISKSCCIIREAIKSGEIGDSQVSGVVLARVDVIDTGHRFASPTDGESYLTSAATGSVTILEPATGTGLQTLAVVLDAPGSGSRIVRFRIKSGQTLAPLGTALARILTWDTDSGEWIEGDDDITVAEPYTAATGNFRAEGGYEGWCVFRAGTTYDIVEMEHVAQQITFTLDHALGYATAGQAEVTVTGVTNGRTPSADPVVVWDPNGHYPRTFAGAKGQAYYDIVNDRYVIFECEQLTLEIYATVTTLCVPSPSYPDDMLLNEAYMRAVPFGKHFFAMPETLPTTYANGLRNPFSFSAKSGDGALLRWDDNYEGTGEGRWIIIEVSKHTYDMITDVAVNEVTDGGAPVKILQKRTMKVQVYTCGDPAWEDIIDTTECPPPE
jgi:hypothetical protein